MKTKHTPGPWRFRNDSFHDGKASLSIVKDDNRCAYLLASVNVFTSPSTGEVLANARLISAAPDGLAAAEIALKRLLALGAEDEPDTCGPCPACQALRAFIAKATGEA